jgi:hypothetical protein
MKRDQNNRAKARNLVDERKGGPRHQVPPTSKEKTVTSKKKNRKKHFAWDYVQVGDEVRLSVHGQPVHAGEVDARTLDGHIIWVHNPVGGRRLFHIEDGYELLVETP